MSKSRPEPDSGDFKKKNHHCDQPNAPVTPADIRPQLYEDSYSDSAVQRQTQGGDDPPGVKFGPMYADLAGGTRPRDPNEPYQDPAHPEQWTTPETRTVSDATSDQTGVAPAVTDWHSPQLKEEIAKMKLTGTEQMIYERLEKLFVEGNYREFAKDVDAAKRSGKPGPYDNAEKALAASLNELGYYVSPQKDGLNIRSQSEVSPENDRSKMLRDFSIDTKNHYMWLQVDDRSDGKYHKHELGSDINKPDQNQAFVTDFGSGQKNAKQPSNETVEDYTKLSHNDIESRILHAKQRVSTAMRKRFADWQVNENIRKQNEQLHQEGERFDEESRRKFEEWKNR